jgi:glycosidase
MAHPLLYQINARCWLRSLAGQAGQPVTLANVPDSEFRRWRQLGFTHIWLMGVWTTGPRSRSVALNDAGLRRRFDEILPGWREEDVPGSPYAIASYEVPTTLGGDAGLKLFRERLNNEGLKLLLDFVPNHVGLDHTWLTEKPDLFVQSPAETAGTFLQNTNAGPRWIAHGRDPYFSPWIDTAQLDYRRPATRAAMIEVLQSVARRCDGVRCDMAMLLLNEVFAKTWAGFSVAGPVPTSEFWADAISAVKTANPDFIFLAEVYWGLEARLQSLGFDYTYDKVVYDCLVERRNADLQNHLSKAFPGHRAASAYFLENHDERRIAGVLPPAEHRAAAALVMGLPGMRMLHDGQLSGRRIQVPVQLGRWPDEPVDAEIQAMYEQILGAR